MANNPPLVIEYWTKSTKEMYSSHIIRTTKIFRLYVTIVVVIFFSWFFKDPDE